MKTLKDKVAFITGGAAGIGLGIARAALAEGMKVVIADIRPGAVQAALASLGAGDRAHAIVLDITARRDMEAAAREVIDTYGRIDLVCNNAGVNLFAPIDESTYDDWDWIMGVNLGGVFNGVHAFAPLLKAQGSGHIVNTASMASFLAGANAGIYTAAKFAVRGMSESLRLSLASHGVSVSVLCPGLVDSDIYKSDEIRPQALSHEVAKVDPNFMAALENVQRLGMSGDEVGRKVIEAVKANRFYIFSHPEFPDELSEIFAGVLAAFPKDEAVDPRRVPMEQGRRAANARARALADSLE